MSKKNITIDQLLASFMVKPKPKTIEPGKTEPTKYATHVDALKAVLKGTTELISPNIFKDEVLQGIVTDVNEGRKLQAVKSMKEASTLGLKESKDIIDTYIEYSKGRVEPVLIDDDEIDLIFDTDDREIIGRSDFGRIGHSM